MASVRVGSAFGIPIRLGTSFLVVVPVLAYLIGSQVAMTAALVGGLLGRSIESGVLTGGLQPWLLGLAAALGLFASVLLHELGHSLVARRYGVAVTAITLWFLGGLAQLERFPEEWRQEFTIAVAGPIVSVALGGLCYLAFLGTPPSLPALQFTVGYLAVLNVVLAGFNLLPGFPMDGGRVLRALLSRNRSRLAATRIAAAVGKGFAVLLGLGGILLGNLFWIAIAFFIYIGASGETRELVYRDAFEGITVGDVMTEARDLDTVTPGTTLDELLDRMVRERHTGYPVVRGDAGDGRGAGDLVGVVTLSDVQAVDADRRGEVTVETVMARDLHTVSPDTPAPEAVRLVRSEGVGRLPVVADGDLVGIVSRTDLMTVFEIVNTAGPSGLGERAVRSEMSGGSSGEQHFEY